MIALIDYCYTSKIMVEESNVQQLLPAACILQLDEIQVCCRSNCLMFLRSVYIYICIGPSYNDSIIKSIINAYLSDNWNHLLTNLIPPSN